MLKASRYFRRMSTCVALVMAATVLLLGCNKRDDLATVSQLRNVYAALKNYNNINGILPPLNRNEWRFSNNTKYHSVSWRALALESIEGLGSRKSPSPIQQSALEASIDAAGRRAFMQDGGMIICMNPEAQADDLSILPKKLLLACAIVCDAERVTWHGEQTLELAAALNNTIRDHGKVFVLFADGTVGISFGTSPSFLERVLSRETSGGIDLKELELHKIILF